MTGRPAKAGVLGSFPEVSGTGPGGLLLVEDPVRVAILVDIGHAVRRVDEEVVIGDVIGFKKGFDHVVAHVIQVGDPVHQPVGVFPFHAITFFHL
jgi:hypothetical protein